MHPWQTAATVTGSSLAALGLFAGGVAYAAMWPTSQIFGRTLVDAPDPDPARHTVALTYDDGPSSRNTPALLDLLAQHNVHATFFLIGNHVRRHPQLAKRVAAAGHTVGNHTNMHPNLARKDAARVRSELERTQHIIQDTLGLTPRIFRPPHGARRPAVLHIARDLGLEPVLWNITAKDWTTIGPDRILKKVDRGMAWNRLRKRTSNLLLHDASNIDGDQPRSRADTLTVTSALLRRSDLQFTTVDRWL